VFPAITHCASREAKDDGGINVIVIKPCGYCNQNYHRANIAITSYKHTFHPFCLRAMLHNSNKCGVCKQKLHPYWWSSWGIHEQNEEMKELAEDMQFEELWPDMVNNVLEATKCGFELKAKGECNFNPIYNLLIFYFYFDLHFFN
jgi:hypothetical protein